MKTIFAYEVEKISKVVPDVDPMIKEGLFPDSIFDFTIQKGQVNILLGSDNLEFHPISWDQRVGLTLSRSRLGARTILISRKVERGCMWL